LECIAATASAASSVDKSSGKDGGMSSQSMIHQCLGKVKDMQSQLTKKPYDYLPGKSLSWAGGK
jgi:hypothetical protein